MAFDKYVESKINFSNPMKGKEWLRLLVPDECLGLTLRKNIVEQNRNKLGFSFSSNEIGFHGKYLPHVENVILGTSFGMGFGVDEGANWFQLDGNYENNYFNLAMPVSPKNHLNALSLFYKGHGKHLIYVYHPNVWRTALSFHFAEKNNKNIFQYLGWRSDSFSVIKLLPKWLIKKIVGAIKRRDIKLSYRGVRYGVNAGYSYFDLDNYKSEFDEATYDLRQIFEKFDSVSIYRVPIKEQLVNRKTSDNLLEMLNTNYDRCWEQFLAKLDDVKSQMNIVDLNESIYQFELKDYLPNDTHWSPSGNKKFVEILKAYEVN